MELAVKLQIKPGTDVAVVAGPGGGPAGLSGLGPLAADPAGAAAVIACVLTAAEITGVASPAIQAARDDRLAWIAYPKAGRLGTDLSRDSLAAAVAGLGIRPVRQVAVDEIWSALRFRPA